MGFKDFFVKKQEDTKPPVTQSKPVTRPVSISNFASAVVPVNTVTSGTDYFAFFNKATQVGMEKGPCYKDFADSLEGLAGQPLTEPQKYTVVFTAFRTQGMTPDKLVQSAMHYDGLIESVRTQFDKDLVVSKKTGVEDKMNEVKTLESDIQKLTEQIQQKTDKINKLNQEAADNANQLTAEEVAFTNAYNTKKAIIQNHINNIKTYLSANTTQQSQG